MRLLLASVVLVSCAAPREVPARRPIDVAALRLQLAPIARPEPRADLRVSVASSLSEPVTIERRGQAGASISIVALDLPDAAFQPVDEHTHAATVSNMEIVHVASAGRFEELRRVHRPIARIEQRYAITRGPLISRLRVVDDIVEALDQNGVARLRTEPAFAIDARGTVRALVPQVEGDVVSFSADASDLVAPIAIDPAWTSTGSMIDPRQALSVFPLPGKKVLVTFAVSDPSPKTEIYDDATASFTAGPALSKSRAADPVLLDDGRIYAFGGAPGPTQTSEVYDPAVGSWKPGLSAPTTGTQVFVAIPLPGARALLLSSQSSTLYDAKAGTWTVTADPSTKRKRPRGLPLKDGRAFVLAGVDLAGLPLSTAEIYDPATHTFSSAGALSALRGGFSVQPLADGRVIVAAGNDMTDSGTVLSTTEIYDPATKTWSMGPKLATARSSAASAVLPDGRMLIAGGGGAESLQKSAEIFDPVAGTWSPAGELVLARSAFGLGPIVAGESRLLAAGGYTGATVRDAEIFAPLGLGKACEGSGECAIGGCVDGVCCEKTTCAAGMTCGGTTTPGVCRKRNGETCASEGDCGSGVCVDGVCCDRACTGTCEACDVESSKGSCTTLAPGEVPHGAVRAKCPGEGACAALCGGIESSGCTIFPGAATACGTSSCKDGSESSASTCDGAGKCLAVPVAKCEPFACGDTACKRACAVDADCATGYSCDARSGKCVFGAKCDGDHTVLVPSSASIDCTPYRCAGASCLAKCATTDDCIAGTTCDTATSTCAAVSASDASGGCGTSGRSPGGGGLLLGWMIVALGAARSGKNVLR